MGIAEDSKWSSPYIIPIPEDKEFYEEARGRGAIIKMPRSDNEEMKAEIAGLGLLSFKRKNLLNEKIILNQRDIERAQNQLNKCQEIQTERARERSKLKEHHYWQFLKQFEKDFREFKKSMIKQYDIFSKELAVINKNVEQSN
ncbi:hypothetical protein L2D08_10660 [Domibacillus sp. PGB-M46]|uniref:hypothetical protein n=1 Tax=Domibacillus sp. PGB-M46 TaxID=2910255 RepID=UPI001F55BD6B|nr:hypothetical protein [Domibacillus sp. PGB-M46]MCI2254824.1 hypothetical protein [Domibacillus sp. PGB-M46]